MKRTKRGMALILAAVMVVSCLTTILLAASKPWTEIDLGSLSQYYETGTNADPGRISNVDGDSGGTSYGLYMFVEKTVTSFMDWLKKSDSAVYRGFGDRLYNAYAYNTSGQYYPGFGSNFKNTWQEIGRNNRTEFAQAQTDFWRDTQYTQLVANVEGQYKGFDIDNYSNALKNVFWSRSVHHGVGATYGSTKNTDGMSGATGVICRAFKALGGFKNQSEAELIAAIYAECSKLDTNGKWDEDNMETLTAKKYGIYGRSMAYFNINSGGVQTSVYSRLHVNEPADALVMRYTHSDPDIPEGEYTLLYNNNGEQSHGLGKSVSTLTAAADAMMLRLTYYNNGYYILTNDDGQRLSVSGGKLVLEAPSTSNNQFWILGGGSGYTLQNMGTKQYVTVTVTSADVTADGQNRDDLIAAKVKEIAQTPAEGQTNAAAEDFSARLEKKLNDLFDEQFKDKNDEAIMAEITANISAMQDITEENKTTLIKKLESLAQSEEETKDDLEARIMESFTADELLLLTEAMTGKSIETVIVEVVGEMVDEDLKNNPTTTVTTYTVGMTDASDKAARWALNKATGKDAWKLTGLFYPGCKDSDGIGGTISHVLTEGNSSFPLRGVISCTQGIRTVVVEVSKVNGSGGFTATGNGSGKTWFDLWELDSQATFSKLTQGSYTMTISGTGSDGKEEELLSTGFTVGAKDSNTPSGLDKEAYTVTFMNGNTQVATKTYSLGDVYGKLPEVSGAGFVGWFTKDGRQVYENSMVAAENHTLSAQFGTLYTVSFKVDGEVIRSRQLSANDLIVAPSNPVKAADKNYVYSFSHWVDGSGNRFVENMTYMPAGNVTYTAVFTKTANSGGGTGGSTGGNTGTNTPKPSGNYLTGVSPSTSVSAMNRAGYTIYSGSTKVTSGLVGTGMTAVSSSATVTIVVTGDVSGDGKITITDVVKLQKSVVGSGSLSGAYAKAADINGDGKVTITDVVQAAQVTVGQRTIG